MKKQIYKYKLNPAVNQALHLPIGAEILCVQMQGADMCLWALVDPNADIEERIIEIYGTGHPINYDMGISRKYISTVQVNQYLVFHIFEYLGV